MSEIDDAMSAEEAAWQQRRGAVPVALPPQEYPYPQQSVPVPFQDQNIIPPANKPFQLIKKNNTHIRVVISTIDSQIPTGFVPSDNPPFVLTVSGNGVVYAEITYSTSDGSISSYDIKKASSIPANDSTHTRCALGTFTTSGGGSLSVLNTGYGPVNSVACVQYLVAGIPYTRSLTASSGT